MNIMKNMNIINIMKEKKHYEHPNLYLIKLTSKSQMVPLLRCFLNSLRYAKVFSFPSSGLYKGQKGKALVPFLKQGTSDFEHLENY